MKLGKLQKEFDKLNLDLQIHAQMLVEICEEISEIANKKINRELIVACAILHDVRNHEKNHALAGAEYAKKVLTKLGYNKKFIDKVYQIILHHTDKNRVKDFITACFYDADILCRFYALGILRAWAHNKVHHPEKNWEKLFKEVSKEKNLKNYIKYMRKKLQLKESKKLLDKKDEEHLASYKLLRELVR
jgi:hypothetical protein